MTYPYKFSPIAAILAWLLLAVQVCSAQADPALRLMTFNIRYNNSGDGFNAWPHRTELVESMIRYHRADLLGVQEALHEQVVAIEQAFPGFGRIGVGRDDGETKGEYSAIFYRRGRLEALQSGHFWLSETPEKPGFGWDAHHNRILTWALFLDKQSGKRFYLMNTHFDHQGVVARRESAKLVLSRAAALPEPTLPLLVMGDFNMTVDSEPYRLLTDLNAPYALRDSWLNSAEAPHGPASTWSGFSFPGIGDRRIDYIFYRNAVQVIQAAALSDSWAGRFPSDHLPFLAEVLIDPIRPLPQAHAHNDYEHTRPLFDALAQGFTSVEADVWLIDGELYVSHDRPAANRRVNLKTTYLEPLARHIAANRHSVYPGYGAPFLLMIDLKNEGAASYELLKKQLAPYAYLLDRVENGRHLPGPVKVFLSGDRPVEQIAADAGQYVGIDGRPGDLGKGYDAQVMPVISESFRKVVNWDGKGVLPESERQKLAALATRVHGEGKRLRLWGAPDTEGVWATFHACGVDLLNADDLGRLQRFLQDKD